MEETPAEAADAKCKGGIRRRLGRLLIKEKSTKTSKSFWIHVSFRKDGKNRQQVKFLIKNK